MKAPLQTERTDPNKPFTFHTRRFVTEQEVTETQLANTEQPKKEKTSNLQGTHFNDSSTEDIAIIGVSGRYPMSNSLEEPLGAFNRRRQLYYRGTGIQMAHIFIENIIKRSKKAGK